MATNDELRLTRIMLKNGKDRYRVPKKKRSADQERTPTRPTMGTKPQSETLNITQHELIADYLDKTAPHGCRPPRSFPTQQLAEAFATLKAKYGWYTQTRSRSHNHSTYWQTLYSHKPINTEGGDREIIHRR